MTDLRRRLIDTWNSLLQSIVDDGMNVNERGGHFEHDVVTELELGLVVQIHWVLF